MGDDLDSLIPPPNGTNQARLIARTVRHRPDTFDAAVRSVWATDYLIALASVDWYNTDVEQRDIKESETESNFRMNAGSL